MQTPVCLCVDISMSVCRHLYVVVCVYMSVCMPTIYRMYCLPRTPQKGFPEDFVLPDDNCNGVTTDIGRKDKSQRTQSKLLRNDNRAYRQLGNAVCPPVVAALGVGSGVCAFLCVRAHAFVCVRARVVVCIFKYMNRH